jgi:acyl-coenzyme A synthetase/AMP-(fatty) acid ligase
MNITDALSEHAERTPGAPAIEDGELRIDYRTLDRAVSRAAAAFRDRGIARGDVVGVALAHHPLHLVACYGLARLGAVQLALPLDQGEPRRAALARRFGASSTVRDADLDAGWLDPRGPTAAGSATARDGNLGWRLVLSSGTTGEPKATLRTHAKAIASSKIQRATMALSAADRYLAVIDLGFYVGHARCVDVHGAGGTVVLHRKQSAAAFFAQVREARVSLLTLTPSMLSKALGNMARSARAMPGLRLLRLESMALTEDLLREIRADVTPNVFNAYGANEIGMLAFGMGEDLARFPGYVGHAAPGVVLQVVDDGGVPLPAGETGLVRARSPAMEAGYFNDAEASAHAFRDGWFYSGDCGALSAEGRFAYRGRADDQMNSDGIKIFPAEIEQVLLEHPAVVEAAAFPMPSPDGENSPAAAVVLRDPQALAGLRRWALKRLGPRAPRFIAGVVALPRNPVGKVRRRLLREKLRQQPG